VALASISYIFKAFIKGTITFIGAVIFISNGSSAVGERLFKTAKARVINNIKGVNRRNLR
jgi:hypothetical protein